MHWSIFEITGLSTCVHRDGMKKRVQGGRILQARKFVVHQSPLRSWRPTHSLRVSAQARARPRQGACCGRIVDKRMCTSSSRQRLTLINAHKNSQPLRAQSPKPPRVQDQLGVAFNVTSEPRCQSLSGRSHAAAMAAVERDERYAQEDPY